MSVARQTPALPSESAADGCRLLHEFFERASARWPDCTAVEVPPGLGRPERSRVTYAELAAQADALAHRLRAFVSGECVVGILLPRNSAWLYVAQLAVLKAGAAYTCVPPSFPDERLRDILDDAEAVALISDTQGVVRALSTGLCLPHLIDIAATPPGDGARTALSATGVGHPLAEGSVRPPWLAPVSLAYVIYTSGTTGRPKGVLIEHGSIANLVAADLAEFQLGPGDRVGQSSSAAYDSSVEETWLALAAGATVVVMDDDTARLGPDLIPWLRRERITVFCPPPTQLRATGCEAPEQELPDLKLLYVGGEALPRDLADRWAKGRKLVNGYGPTECTVTALRGVVHEGRPIPIGWPVPGLQAWVLNDALDPLPDGAQGELCLGGLGLARGYWKQPELTAEKFVQHPELGRIYRTGDIAHRESDGCFYYRGRMDSQVKIRGYRVELGEIESHLARCAGVRAAACRVQTEGAHPVLVAFIVPHDAANPPPAEEFRAALKAALPDYSVPARFGYLAQLPTTVGGKLDRAALPGLDGTAHQRGEARVPPGNPLEEAIEAAVRDTLRLKEPVSVHDDFFTALGGDSLAAALLVTQLREDAATAWVTVRDVYEARTVAELARRAHGTGTAAAPPPAEESSRLPGRPFLATVAQGAWLLVEFMVMAVAAGFIGLELLPWLMGQLGLVPFLLILPVLGLAVFLAYAPFSVLLAVAVKRVLIGRYRPLRAPVWGGFYLRNWIVQAIVRLVPWRLMEGTVFQHTVLRMLGARIGRRVHIHRGVDLQRGGWDLLEIGDDVTLSQDASVRLVELDAGEVVIGPVTLGDGSTLDVRAGVGGHTVLESGAYLAALSTLPPGGRVPQGERWDGIPAGPAGSAPAPPRLPDDARALSPLQHGFLLVLLRAGLALLLVLPLEALTIATCLAFGLDSGRLWEWMFQPAPETTPWLVGLCIVLVGVPLTLAFEAAIARLVGRVSAGLIGRWSLAYARVWLKTGLVQSAGEWLSGTLFWPVWLRAAGMSVGRGCEISTIVDVVPELITLGADNFFADGIYLGGPRVHRGTVTLAATRFGDNTFLGNHVVVPAGQQMPEDILLGICTLADDARVRAGSSWFGHPPFELPRREVVACDRRFTHEPPFIRYWNRVFWEVLRSALPIGPLLVLVAWFRLLAWSGQMVSGPAFLFGLVPLVTLGAAASLVLFILALKWVLLGRVRPGQHPLWSCWCSRWDFLYVAWGQYARPTLAALEGTLLLSWFLRAMGMKLGRGVVLGPGFAQVVDPDMIRIEDGATVNAMFQAHTFEDRVLKIDRICIRQQATLGSATVPLYGADIGAHTRVAPHGVIMKRERLLPGLSYEGAPTQPLAAGGA